MEVVKYVAICLISGAFCWLVGSFVSYMRYAVELEKQKVKKLSDIELVLNKVAFFVADVADQFDPEGGDLIESFLQENQVQDKLESDDR